MLLTKSASLPISKGPGAPQHRSPEDRHSFPSRFVALYGPTRSQLSKQGFVILQAKKQGKPPAVQTTMAASPGIKSCWCSASRGFAQRAGTTPPPRSGPRRSAAPAAAPIQARGSLLKVGHEAKPRQRWKTGFYHRLLNFHGPLKLLNLPTCETGLGTPAEWGGEGGLPPRTPAKRLPGAAFPLRAPQPARRSRHASSGVPPGPGSPAKEASTRHPYGVWQRSSC